MRVSDRQPCAVVLEHHHLQDMPGIGAPCAIAVRHAVRMFKIEPAVPEKGGATVRPALAFEKVTSGVTCRRQYSADRLVRARFDLLQTQNVGGEGKRIVGNSRDAPGRIEKAAGCSWIPERGLRPSAERSTLKTQLLRAT